MKKSLHPKVIKDARNHARNAFPHESCGLVVADTYIPCTNTADDPENDFQIDPKEWVAASTKGPIQAVLHSHPNGPLHPTESDMRRQIETAVPWGIIGLDDERVGEPIMFGDQWGMQPLIGREFVWGVSDCYSLIRDTFRLGREGCAEQGIVWPFNPIELPEVPRDDDFYTKGQDLYGDWMKKTGWVEIPMQEAQPGDGWLMKWKSDKLNHAGLLIGGDLLMHQLPLRLSRREPAGIWARAADVWVRYKGEGSPYA